METSDETPPSQSSPPCCLLLWLALSREEPVLAPPPVILLHRPQLHRVSNRICQRTLERNYRCAHSGDLRPSRLPLCAVWMVSLRLSVILPTRAAAMAPSVFDPVDLRCRPIPRDLPRSRLCFFCIATTVNFIARISPKMVKTRNRFPAFMRLPGYPGVSSQRTVFDALTP